MIGVGVLGLGLGAGMTVPWMLADDRFAVTAAADLRVAAREAFERDTGGSAFAEVGEVCIRPDVDLVYVATPHYLHADHALTAIENGKHVLVEKPLERSSQRAAEIAEAAAKRGVYAFYGHSHASDPVIRAVASMVASGDYGDLGLVLTFNFNDMLMRPRADWELDQARSGGSPWIQGAHQVDVARFIAASPVVGTSGWSRSLRHDRVVPGAHAALLEFESGSAALMAFAGYGHFDTAELNGWVAETGVPRSPSTHHSTYLSYLRRQGGDEAEPEMRDRRRIGSGRLEPAAPLQFLETFGETIVACSDADLRPTPHGVVVDTHGERRDLSIPPISGRQVMLDEIVGALASDQPPALDCAWAVETVRVAEAMEAA